MFKQLLVLLIGSISATSLLAQGNEPHVSVAATLERGTDSTATLVIQATIADGLHIYGLQQPKPFLATKIEVDESPAILNIGEFRPSRAPLQLRHDTLEVDLYEHEGTIEWRAPIRLAGKLPNDFAISGSVFAQACEDGRCFAPQLYSFQATAFASSKPIDDGNQSVAKTATNTENAAFSLDNLEIDSSIGRSAFHVLPLAFVAGFLLNFMPCVLPVVGLKVLSFAQQADSNRTRILLLNLSFSAGLLFVMVILATLASFAGLGWGEQFSSATFTVTLSAIVFAFGLSFLGVWEIPLPGSIGTADGQLQQEGYGGAFAKGVLSTLLATPCSGPFLGAALAWAVTQPTYLTYAVFVSVGLGMASPFLVIGLFPQAIRLLPRPGAWMVTFKQLMGFMMLATVVYLLSFMAVSAVVPTVLLLLGIGFALWQVGKTPIYAQPIQLAKAWILTAFLVSTTAIASFGWLQPVMQARFERAAERWVAAIESLPPSASHSSQAVAWQPYSKSRLEKAIASGSPVFVDFTADWCLTCKSNEAAAIETPQFATALAEGGIIALRADKTEPNDEADELLRKLGNSAASIPFYAFFPSDKPEEPILLDGVFASPAPFVAAAKRATGPSDWQDTPMVIGAVHESR